MTEFFPTSRTVMKLRQSLISLVGELKFLFFRFNFLTHREFRAIQRCRCVVPSHRWMNKICCWFAFWKEPPSHKWIGIKTYLTGNWEKQVNDWMNELLCNNQRPFRIFYWLPVKNNRTWWKLSFQGIFRKFCAELSWESLAPEGLRNPLSSASEYRVYENCKIKI